MPKLKLSMIVSWSDQRQEADMDYKQEQRRCKRCGGKLLFSYEIDEVEMSCLQCGAVYYLPSEKDHRSILAGAISTPISWDQYPSEPERLTRLLTATAGARSLSRRR